MLWPTTAIEESTNLYAREAPIANQSNRQTNTPEPPHQQKHHNETLNRNL
jgi:hypothetical protein